MRLGAPLTSHIAPFVRRVNWSLRGKQRVRPGVGSQVMKNHAMRLHSKYPKPAKLLTIYLKPYEQGVNTPGFQGTEWPHILRVRIISYCGRIGMGILL